MSCLDTFIEEVKSAHEKLEREGAGFKSELRELKNKSGKYMTEDETTTTLEKLKQVTGPLEDMIKFLEDIKLKTIETEVKIYEENGVVSRRIGSRNQRGVNHDSGYNDSTDSTALNDPDSRVYTRGGYLLVTESDSSSKEPTQHADSGIAQTKEEADSTE